MLNKLGFWAIQLFLASFLLAGIAPSARAQAGAPVGPDPFTLTFDEYGNGQINNGGTISSLTGSLAQDPTTITPRPVLTYMLPDIVGNGYVQVLDGLGAVGDLLLFTDSSGHTTGSTADRLIFYSDADTTPTDTALADISGIPSVTTSNQVTESGTEGNNGFQFVASLTGGGTDTYNGISDGTLVPEPSTLLLLGSGLLSIVGLARKKN